MLSCIVSCLVLIMFDFFKYHCFGNDVVMVFQMPTKYLPALLHRSLGVGADQAFVLRHVDEHKGAVFLDIINQDGSVAQQCLNGMLCLALFLKERYPSVLRWEVRTEDQLRYVSTSSLGVWVPKRSCRLLALSEPKNAFRSFVGNKHLIVFVDCASTRGEDLLGHLRGQTRQSGVLADDENFTVAYRSSDGVSIETWERGVGKTMACGSAALATALVCAHLSQDTHQHIHVPLGHYDVWVDEEGCLLSAQAHCIARGTVAERDLEASDEALNRLKTISAACSDHRSAA